ncbi:MAG: DUF192 domain-containing protein [Deltaproteobacteria bacterium]|nr:DUF192 domain-containing protein [Deltaproteobacteria bacterium]
MKRLIGMMNRPHVWLIALLCFFSFLQTAIFCQVATPKAGSDQASLPPEARLTRISVGAAVLWVEVASTPEAQTRGLMFRESLPWDRGMLFVYEKPQYLAFWMKNTTIPLDIAFISADGRIAQIRSLIPLSEKTRSSRAPALYALEVNRGWFRKKGIKVGDKIRF